MAVTTNLATINLSTGIWVELSGALEGRISNNDPDNFIAGSNSTPSQTRTGGNVSIATPTNEVRIQMIADGILTQMLGPVSIFRSKKWHLH